MMARVARTLLYTWGWNFLPAPIAVCLFVHPIADQRSSASDHSSAPSIELCTEDDNDELVRMMKRLVPEFKSKNSKYEKLDGGNTYAVFSDMASNS
ncbi:MAG: hypothetical protein EOO00_14325 [Chitinophagaceae bacterium]|nr:MAG: hypothetical protein EOO00_14325 [Chitinophagaceae bacterium]